jgi:hypothetical protein
MDGPTPSRVSLRPPVEADAQPPRAAERLDPFQPFQIGQAVTYLPRPAGVERVEAMQYSPRYGWAAHISRPCGPSGFSVAHRWVLASVLKLVDAEAPSAIVGLLPENS